MKVGKKEKKRVTAFTYVEMGKGRTGVTLGVWGICRERKDWNMRLWTSGNGRRR